MKKIVATFVGLDGSLGYITDQPYLLFIKSNSRGEIQICRANSVGVCFYSNMEMFMTNWTNIITNIK